MPLHADLVQRREIVYDNSKEVYLLFSMLSPTPILASRVTMVYEKIFSKVSVKKLGISTHFFKALVSGASFALSIFHSFPTLAWSILHFSTLPGKCKAYVRTIQKKK